MRRFLKSTVCILLLVTLLCVNLVPALALYTVTDSKESAATRDELLTKANNDYLSRTETTYHGINGNDVTVYGFYRDYLESGNNPNFSQILLVYQSIKYKEKYPEENVCITVQSFHLSIALAGCVDPTKPEYGHTKNLYDSEYTEDGYYRLSYLLVEAARKGIEVTVIGQLDAAPVAQKDGVVSDFNFVQYFNSHLSDDAYISGRKVSDYMDFRYCEWTSYGDKAAADMMHNKLCTVSHYIDNSGNEHGGAVWTGSINLDGVNHLEQNGNDSIQTAVVVTGHEELRRVAYNYARLMIDYCGQEDIVPFRTVASSLATEQARLIAAGDCDKIPKDEQIIYLGTENDPVFELYFTPLGGSFSTWDTLNNPYAKYIAAMLAVADGEDYIEFVWNNAKFNQTFELADTMVEAVAYAFELNNNKNSLLHLQLPGLDTTYFDKLVAGQNIGYKCVNETYLLYHTKDLQLSYVEGEERIYVTVLNSLNIHEGSMYHQTNTILVIKENGSVGNNFYSKYASLTTPGFNFLSRHA